MFRDWLSVVDACSACGLTLKHHDAADGPAFFALVFVGFLIMALVGLVASGCFMLITKALSLAPASLLAPLQYTAIVWASILGWIFWSDKPTPHIILGNCIIIGSGLFVLYRERTLKVDVNQRIEPIP